MAEIVCTRGLPASGKTTWAKEWLREDAENRVRMGRDPLRDLLYGTRKGLTNAQEGFLSKVQVKGVETALASGKSVVIDDLNLKLSYLEKWRKLAERKGYGWRVQDFDTDIEECVRRDRLRAPQVLVGESVIRELHRRFPLRQATRSALEPVVRVPFVPDPTKPDAIIVDIDGTVAEHNGRSPYDYSLLHTDKVIENVKWFLEQAGWSVQTRVLFMSGRPNDHREATERWLNVNGLTWDMLFMRPSGDNRDDALVKYELFDQRVRPYFNVRAVLDDRDRVVDMWRSIGLTCLQVAPGDF